MSCSECFRINERRLFNINATYICCYIFLNSNTKHNNKIQAAGFIDDLLCFVH